MIADGKGVYHSQSGFSGGLGCFRQILVNPWRQGRAYFLEPHSDRQAYLCGLAT